MTLRLSRLLATCAVLACAFASGCTGTTRAQGTVVFGYPAEHVETVPAHTVYQPRVYYRGRYAYLVDGRWYYPGDRGWVVFREEPRELQRYRVNSGDPARYRYRYRTTPEYRYRTPEYGSPPPRPRPY